MTNDVVIPEAVVLMIGRLLIEKTLAEAAARELRALLPPEPVQPEK